MDAARNARTPEAEAVRRAKISAALIGNTDRVTHGQSGSRLRGIPASPIYGVWSAMLQRCNNPRHPAYEDYGGRGPH